MKKPDFEVRFHHLKLAGTKSPQHLRALLDAGDPGGDTYPIERGTALHALLFGTRRVTFFPGKVRNGKKWKQFQAENGDAEILNRADYAKASGMAEAVSKHADAMRVLTGTREVTLRWEQMGIPCRVTPDVAKYAEYATELKSCATSEPVRFGHQALRYGYHAQLAWQLYGIKAAGLGKPTDAYVVAVESSAPYPVTVLKLTSRALEQGDRLWRLWWERLCVCLESDQWPGYTQTVVDLDVPEDALELDYGDAVEAA